MKKQNRLILSLILTSFLLLANCSKTESDPDDSEPDNGAPLTDFYFGVDLSYVNQILDFEGEFLDDGQVRDPYRIFADNGANLARFRLWHNPQWTQDIYGEEGKQLYNGLMDIEKSIASSKAQGMEVLLDFHYSDVWADPGRQEIPEAWKEITSIGVLKDSIYNYTYKTLNYLAEKGLMPELVQIGNETNCGMMYTDAPANFPKLNVCNDNWSNMGQVINSAIAAVRDVASQEGGAIKVILHVADPVNVQWWFDSIIDEAKVTDFDIIGFSYYPIWHSGISINNLSNTISEFKNRYHKDIMILETAYPWTPDGNDNYNNIFGVADALTGYPLTQTGQKSIIHDITQQVVSGGGIGVIYWEPAWITSKMKDLWGQGSSWENCTFFDFTGSLHEGIDYMTDDYE